MSVTRRQFIKGSLTTGAVAVAAGSGVFNPRRVFPFAQSTPIRKFVTTLPGVTPAGKNGIGQYITVAAKRSVMFAGLPTDQYNIAATKFSQRVHPDLPGNTTFFGYADVTNFDQKYLGGAIVAKRGTPVLLNITNLLPSQHILPVDPTLMTGPNGQMVMDLPVNRLSTHLHGGFVHWFSDGTPLQWFTPSNPNMRGISFQNPPGIRSVAGTSTYYYPNQQSARMMWYHDHAIGVTRLNAYAGLATAYFITDDFEQWLARPAGPLGAGLLPDALGIPLVIQDKSFVPTDVATQDPGWRWGGPGSLWYPHDYEVNTFADGTPNPKGRWDWGPTAVPPMLGVPPFPTLPPVSCVPEFFADTAMINGAPYPVLNVTDKAYRFRMLNGSQARFWHLALYVEDGDTGEPLIDTNVPGQQTTYKPGPFIYQIGNEGGFLPAIAVHQNTPIPLVIPTDPTIANPDGPFNMLLAPAERSDFLIDFTGKAGQSFILYNDAPAPFPMGDLRNDYFTGNADQTAFGGAPPTQIGQGPNTRTVMKFVVSAGAPGLTLDTTWQGAMNAALAANFTAAGNAGIPGQQEPQLYDYGTGSFTTPPIRRRVITLNEDFDDLGRLIQRGGTDIAQPLNNQGLPTFGQGYLDSITEEPLANTVEVWDIFNTTGDVHPWHLHLVNAQVVGRGVYALDLAINDGFTPNFTDGSWKSLSNVPGQLTPPDPNEMGWKETIRCNPGEITRLVMKFALPTLPPAWNASTIPLSPRTNGYEYVHHCHILEHEEHDMMRTLNVKP